MKSKRVRVWAALLMLSAAATAGWAGLDAFDRTQENTTETRLLRLSGLPTECLLEPNHGQCVECCKAAVGPLQNPSGEPKDAGKACARFCQAVTPPGQNTPSEPQP